MRQFARFIAAGLINSVIGYAIILAGLRSGLGDYSANGLGYAIGLAISYLIQRHWVFAVRRDKSAGEIMRFLAAAACAYSANLVVVFGARSIGYVTSPVAQALAMGCYSVTFFLLSRLMVFAAPNSQGRRHD